MSLTDDKKQSEISTPSSFAFLGVMGAPVLLTPGRYKFAESTVDDMEADLALCEDYKGEVLASVPNRVAYNALTEQFDLIAFRQQLFNQLPGTTVYCTSPAVRTNSPNAIPSVQDYKDGKKYKISMFPADEVARKYLLFGRPTYIWGNRMMVGQPNGTYELGELKEDYDFISAFLRLVPFDNIYLGHESTAKAVGQFRNLEEDIPVRRDSYPALRLNESAIVVVPKTSGPIVAGTDLKTSTCMDDYSYFILVRDE